jgi:hypothetical protein
VQSNAARLGVIAAAAAAAIVLFLVLQGGDDNGGDGGGGTTTSATGKEATAGPVITVRDGEPVGGVETLTFDKGDQVRFEVRLDGPAEEIHVHGYDREIPATKSPVEASFPADLDGVFEIELHGTDGSETQIAELRVNP